jgi:23S rRNA (pseudouridine1915-N3)-methyltransferase
MQISIITIGKTRSKEIQSLCDDFENRIKKFKIQNLVLKAHGDDVLKEQAEIENKLKDFQNSSIYLLSEWGKQFTSKQFSSKVQGHYENSEKLVFIIGGASGFTEEFRNKFKNQFSLSNMTYPHEIAKLMLFEQIYRAQAIMDNHPYSK